MDLEQYKYPIGKFIKPEIITREILHSWIEDIETLPERLKKEVENLSERQLDTPYRQDGWTLRQVIHHLADAHLNAFIRVKLALTEENPVVKPYFEERWAELPDSQNFPVRPSLKIIKGIHQRWSFLLKTLSEQDFQKVFIHPENNREFKLEEILGIYAWHGNHHLAHISTLKKQKGWE